MTKTKKIINITLEVIFILLIIFSLVLIIKWFIDTRNNKKIIDDINTKLNIEEVRTGKNDIDYDYLVNINSDTVGYIIVEGTSINYPVVKTINNEYYLKHSFDKSYNSAGWIFMDYRNNNINDKNIIIYGHNMKDGSMFGKLKLLKKNKESYITYYDNNIKYRYKVFSIYEIEEEDYYLKTVFNGNEYNNFINTLKNRSLYDYGYTPNNEDNIITLSTCTSGSKRLVVHAYRLN